jgi:hypothetical protein
LRTAERERERERQKDSGFSPDCDAPSMLTSKTKPSAEVRPSAAQNGGSVSPPTKIHHKTSTRTASRITWGFRGQFHIKSMFIGSKRKYAGGSVVICTQ